MKNDTTHRSFFRVKYTFLLFTLTFAWLFCGCANHPSYEFISPKDVEGHYHGVVQINTAYTRSTSIDMEVKIEADTVYFEHFPINQLVDDVLGTDATIAWNSDKVDYKVGYKATLNDDYSKILLHLDPKPLHVFYLENTPVDVTLSKLSVEISADDMGVYFYDNRNLRFVLHTEGVVVNNEAWDKPKTLSFSFSFQKQS